MTRSPHSSDPVLDQAAALGIVHEVMPCDPELADTAAFCAAYGVAPEDSANAILVAGKSRADEPQPFALCLVLATHRLDVNGIVRRRLGSRKASFANADQTRSLTGMEIGGITAVGLPDSLPLWVDSRVMLPDYVILGGGSRSIKIKVSPQIFRLTPNTTIIEDLAFEQHQTTTG